jgi:hypothetical protein
LLVSRGCVGITLSGLNKKSITERRIGRLRLIPEIVVEGKPIVLEEDHIKGLLATCRKGLINGLWTFCWKFQRL